MLLYLDFLSRFTFTLIFYLLLKWAIKGTETLLIQSLSMYIIVFFFAIRSIRHSNLFNVTVQGTLTGPYIHLGVFRWDQVLNHWESIFTTELQVKIHFNNTLGRNFVFVLPKRGISFKQWFLSGLILSYFLAILFSYLL